MSGDKFRLFIENAGATDYIEVEGQKDGTLTLGRDAQADVTKGSQNPYITRSGATFSTTVSIENPLDASQTQLLAVSDAETLTKVKVEDVSAGGLGYSGEALVKLNELSTPVDGVQEFSLMAVFKGDPVRAASPIAYA